MRIPSVRVNSDMILIANERFWGDIRIYKGRNLWNNCLIVCKMNLLFFSCDREIQILLSGKRYFYHILQSFDVILFLKGNRARTSSFAKVKLENGLCGLIPSDWFYIIRYTIHLTSKASSSYFDVNIFGFKFFNS